MSANPIDQNTTPKTTGNLEELFRHHLGDEAAVPTRPMLWDQIDNSLLVKQNEVYRRRLTATRWVAAASILLASLAGTGWWAGRDALLTGRDVATVASPATSRTGTAAQETVAAVASRPSRNATGRNPRTAASSAVPAADLSGYQPSASAAASEPSPAAQLAMQGRSAPAPRFGERQRYQRPAANPTAISGILAVSPAPTGLSIATPAATTIAAAPSDSEQLAAAVANSTTSVATASVATTSVAAATGAAADGVATGSLATALAPATTAAPTALPAAAEEVGSLVARSATLALADAEALPAGLAQATVPAEVPAIAPHRWRYSGSYTAGVFNPNINFSRTGIEPAYDYDASPAFGANSAALTEDAAAEYRANLRPGFSQRLALLATRHLQGHWSLRTGVEVSQATAHSASSAAFVGEQLFDLGQYNLTPQKPLQNTDFRYRLASVPVEVSYANSVKQGWSFYGRLGGVVSALLGVRSDVEGNPEATRTYSLLSAGSPYRQVLASVRGGAGAQFRTSSGKWALSAGPVADLGLVTLNAHPSQSYFAQSRPYSLGVEAAIEFGR